MNLNDLTRTEPMKYPISKKEGYSYLGESKIASLYDKLLKNAIMTVSDHLGIKFITDIPKLDMKYYVLYLEKPMITNNLSVENTKEIFKEAIYSTLQYINSVIENYFISESYSNVNGLISILNDKLTDYDYSWKFELDSMSLNDIGESLAIENLRAGLNDKPISAVIASKEYERDFVVNTIGDYYKELIKHCFNTIATLKFQLNNGQNGYPADQLVQRKKKEGIKVHVDQPVVPIQMKPISDGTIPTLTPEQIEETQSILARKQKLAVDNYHDMLNYIVSNYPSMHDVFAQYHANNPQPVQQQLVPPIPIQQPQVIVSDQQQPVQQNGDPVQITNSYIGAMADIVRNAAGRSEEDIVKEITDLMMWYYKTYGFVPDSSAIVTPTENGGEQNADTN